MAIIEKDSKIQRDIGGSVLKEDNSLSNSLILKVDTDIQELNRIHKDSSNKVRQITDKANDIPFVQTDPAKQPTYNYDGYYESNNSLTSVNGIEETNLNGSFWIRLYINFKSFPSSAWQIVFGKANGSSYDYYFRIQSDRKVAFLIWEATGGG